MSDGTDAPGDLVRLAGEAGLDVVAITDHDTTAGWAPAAQAATRLGVGLVRGMEVSAHADQVSVHILSYLHDPTHLGLLAATKLTRDSRLTRAVAMVERISADYPITWADVVAQAAPDATIGRPHIADALVAAGVVPDRSAAFARILAPSGPYYVPHASPDAVTVIRAIRAAGGVPVFAHPAARMRGRVVSMDVIAQFAAAGLMGVEADHRDHTPQDREQLTDAARGLGLFVTGSSDFHGAGKPNLLGENLTDLGVLDIIAEHGTVEVIWPSNRGEGSRSGPKVIP